MRIQETVPFELPVTAREHNARLSLVTDIANERLARPEELVLGGFCLAQDSVILPDVWHRATPQAASQREELILKRNQALLNAPLSLAPLPRRTLSDAELRAWDAVFGPEGGPPVARTDREVDGAFKKFLLACDPPRESAKAKRGRRGNPVQPQGRVFVGSLPQAA